MAVSAGVNVTSDIVRSCSLCLALLCQSRMQAPLATVALPRGH